MEITRETQMMSPVQRRTQMMGTVAMEANHKADTQLIPQVKEELQHVIDERICSHFCHLIP